MKTLCKYKSAILKVERKKYFTITMLVWLLLDYEIIISKTKGPCIFYTIMLLNTIIRGDLSHEMG